MWEGLERFIGRTSPTTAGSWTYEHEIFWLGVQEYQTTGCGTYGYCWLQAGHGIGSVLTAHTTTQRLYYEYEGPDGAGDFADFPTFASVGADDFYNSYRDGINDQEGHPYFEAWTNAGGLQQMAYTPMLATQGTDESEAEASSTDGTWPSIGGVALFGTNGTTTYSSSWSLFKSNDGTSWIEWVNSPNLCNESPYARTTLHNWSAFKAY